jgi:N-methylhydantoinase A
MHTHEVTVPVRSGASAYAEAVVAPDEAAREFWLSIDTGGTFTDGFVSDGARSAQVKVDTTPHDLTVGFQACVAAAADAVGQSLPDFLSRLAILHFSSTIATNTIVERRGARVGLIVTGGAEETWYGTSDQASALRDFVGPDVVRGVPEQVDERGIVIVEPDGADIDVAVRELLERGVRLLVVSFANAHLNPANELRARAIIDASYPRHYLGAVPLMIASRISLAPDDHGRTCSAVFNAYLHPNLVRALYRAEDETRAEGLRRPLLIVNTDGSSTRVAKTRAIDTYNSGPSAGVLGAGYVARALGAGHVCTFDVGGTTTDVAYLRDGEPPRAESTEVGPARIPHPSIDLYSFGLGGGSVITLADNGFRVGPESAGSAPGPACFGLGGDALTPTDVWVLLGYLEPGEFLGGRRRLERERAEQAAGRLAERLGLRVEEAALQAKAAIRAALANELTRWAQRHPGLTAAPEDERWLFSYGGGGGLLCVEAAEALRIPRVVVFPHSSVFSAFGGGLLPIAHTYERVIPTGSPQEALAAAVARLADDARRDLRAEGVVALHDVAAELTLAGTPGRSLPLAELLERPLVPEGIATPLAESLRCRLTVTVPREARVDMVGADDDPVRGTREVLTRDGLVRVPVAEGLGRPGAEPVGGPVFLDAPDTTIFVPGGWSAEFTGQGYGVLTKEGSWA